MDKSHTYSLRDDNYEYRFSYHPDMPELISQCTIISTNNDIEIAQAPSKDMLPKLKASSTISLDSTFRKHRNLKDVWAFFEYLYHNDLTRIISTASMFQCCDSLTDLQPLNLLSTVYIIDTSLMFSWCFRLRDISPLALWDMSHVRNIHGMFLNCTSLHDVSPLLHWNTKNAKKKRLVFCNCDVSVGKDIALRIDPPTS